MKVTIDLVVFDTVGTTVEDGGQVENAFVGTLQGYGIAVRHEEITPWRGAPKRDVLRFFLAKEMGRDNSEIETLLDRAHADFQERLEEQYRSGGVKAIRGAESTFVWLHDQGIKIALTTGFYRQLADIILSATGWYPETIDATVCSDDVTRGRPAPYMIFRAMEQTGVYDVRRVAKIGDTVLDLEAGMNAGVAGVIGVLSGSHGLEALGHTAHTHIIPSVADLPGLLEAQFIQ